MDARQIKEAASKSAMLQRRRAIVIERSAASTSAHLEAIKTNGKKRARMNLLSVTTVSYQA
jgi:hypothetical protein